MTFHTISMEGLNHIKGWSSKSGNAFVILSCSIPLASVFIYQQLLSTCFPKSLKTKKKKLTSKFEKPLFLSYSTSRPIILRKAVIGIRYTRTLRKSTNILIKINDILPRILILVTKETKASVICLFDVGCQSQTGKTIENNDT